MTSMVTNQALTGFHGNHGTRANNHDNHRSRENYHDNHKSRESYNGNNHGLRENFNGNGKHGPGEHYPGHDPGKHYHGNQEPGKYSVRKMLPVKDSPLSNCRLSQHSYKPRSQSVSDKRGRQKNKQPLKMKDWEQNNYIEESFVRNRSLSLNMTQQGNAIQRDKEKRISSPVHSRSSSITCYFSSASSSALSSASSSASFETASIMESPEQFWNKYRRKARRQSLGQLVKQALSPKHKAEIHPSSPPHMRKVKSKDDSEPEYSEIYEDSSNT